MRYVADHDYHIHSTVSLCCHDDTQTPEAILDYAVKNGFSSVCLTNHFWDERVRSEAEWCDEHDFAHVSAVLPLPQADGTRFLFGAETDMDYNNIVGISQERMDLFDFIIVSTTHLHLDGNTVKSEIRSPEEAAFHWLDKIEALLGKDMPWHRTGIAHLTTGHILKGRTHEVLQLLSDRSLYDVFGECAAKGAGIELNMKTIGMSHEQREIFLRPYFIAKECGCKFYLGSDSHKAAALTGTKENFEHIITTLDLKESDKFRPEAK